MSVVSKEAGSRVRLVSCRHSCCEVAEVEDGVRASVDGTSVHILIVFIIKLCTGVGAEDTMVLKRGLAGKPVENLTEDRVILIYDNCRSDGVENTLDDGVDRHLQCCGCSEEKSEQGDIEREVDAEVRQQARCQNGVAGDDGVEERWREVQ